MKCKIVEAGGNPLNWGKFMVCEFTTEEWKERSHLPDNDNDIPRSLLYECGWSARHYWIMDLQTGEGALFRPGGSAHADLTKHQIWVCPLFEPFLEWLYPRVREDVDFFDTLPRYVDLPEASASFHGRRRPGPVFGDAILAMEFFDEHTASDLRSSGVTEDAVDWWRRRYVSDVAHSSNAREQLRKTQAEPPKYDWDGRTETIEHEMRPGLRYSSTEREAPPS